MTNPSDAFHVVGLGIARPCDSLQAAIAALASSPIAGSRGFTAARAVTLQRGPNLWYVYRSQADLDRDLSPGHAALRWVATVRARPGRAS